MSDIPNLLKKLRSLGTCALKEDWKKGKRCPECGVSSERLNCAIDAGSYCQAHDHRYYKLSSEDYVFKADEHAQAAAALIEKQQGEIKRLQDGLRAVENLINDSHGVVGLHLNGDIAPWEELRTGGCLEEWLVAFDAALAETAP